MWPRHAPRPLPPCLRPRLVTRPVRTHVWDAARAVAFRRRGAWALHGDVPAVVVVVVTTSHLECMASRSA